MGCVWAPVNSYNVSRLHHHYHSDCPILHSAKENKYMCVAMHWTIKRNSYDMMTSVFLLVLYSKFVNWRHWTFFGNIHKRPGSLKVLGLIYFLEVIQYFFIWDCCRDYSLFIGSDPCGQKLTMVRQCELCRAGFCLTLRLLNSSSSKWSSCFLLFFRFITSLTLIGYILLSARIRRCNTGAQLSSVYTLKPVSLFF